MSEFKKDDIKALSKLCRIELNEQECDEVFASLSRIIDYVSQLGEVDVSHLSPYSHSEALEIHALRDDEVDDTLPREKFLANAPDQVAGMVRVPTVMKH